MTEPNPQNISFKRAVPVPWEKQTGISFCQSLRNEARNKGIFSQGGVIMTSTVFFSYKSEDCFYEHTFFDCAPIFPMHNHAICELIFIRNGNATYHLDGKIYPLAANSLVLSRPGQTHAIEINPNSEYDRYDILFDEKNLSSDIYNQIPSDISVVNFSRHSIVSEVFRKMDYYCENFEGTDFQIILQHLIEEILYNTVIFLKERTADDVYTVNPLINKAVAYIDENITSAISIAAICDELYITKSHLHQLFMKHLNTSPQKYIASKKMILAQQDLRAGKKATDVAFSYGFHEYSTFYRDYKNHFGYPPSDEIHQKYSLKILS
jgi:AraC-like DNA-binding protein/mannose-6-phosphate isomerase-like protein (cupin superfamily)